MRYSDFKIVEARQQLKESAGTTRITVGQKTYEVGNDLIMQGGVYQIFSGASARQWADANGYIVPPREVILAVYQQAQPLMMPVRNNNPTDTNARAHTQEIIELNGEYSGLVAGHKKEITASSATTTHIYGGRWEPGHGRTPGSIIQNTPSPHDQTHVDYSQGMRTCREINESNDTSNAQGVGENTAGNVYVIGDSHAVAMGGSNNLAANGARLSAIARQANQVPRGATVYMTGGHNDVPAGTNPQQIASQVQSIISSLEGKGCTVNYILFPEGSSNTNQEQMAPTRRAINSLVTVARDLDGCSLSDGIHCQMSAYSGIVNSSASSSRQQQPTPPNVANTATQRNQPLDGSTRDLPIPEEIANGVLELAPSLRQFVTLAPGYGIVGIKTTNGEIVRQLQTSLNRAGYDLEVDGISGNNTRAAIIDIFYTIAEANNIGRN